MEIADNGRFLTTTEVAKKLAVDASKVRGWILSGQLVAINVSKSMGGQARYRVSPEELEKFIARRTCPMPQPVVRRRSRYKRVYS